MTTENTKSARGFSVTWVLEIWNRKVWRRKNPHGISIEVVDVRAVGDTNPEVMNEYGEVKYIPKL